MIGPIGVFMVAFCNPSFFLLQDLTENPSMTYVLAVLARVVRSYTSLSNSKYA